MFTAENRAWAEGDGGTTQGRQTSQPVECSNAKAGHEVLVGGTQQHTPFFLVAGFVPSGEPNVEILLSTLSSGAAVYQLTNRFDNLRALCYVNCAPMLAYS